MPTTKVKVFFFTHWQLFFSTLYYASFPIWLVRVLFLFSTFILHLSQFFTACQSILPFFYHPILPLSQLFTAYQSTLNIFYPLSCIFPNFLQLIQLSLFVPSSLHLSHIFTACQSTLPCTKNENEKKLFYFSDNQLYTLCPVNIVQFKLFKYIKMLFY